MDARQQATVRRALRAILDLRRAGFCCTALWLEQLVTRAFPEWTLSVNLDTGVLGLRRGGIVISSDEPA